MMAAGLGWSRRQQESQSLRGHLTLMIIFLAGEHHRLSPSQAERGGGGSQILINILIINYNLQLTIIYCHQAGRQADHSQCWLTDSCQLYWQLRQLRERAGPAGLVIFWLVLAAWPRHIETDCRDPPVLISLSLQAS